MPSPIEQDIVYRNTAKDWTIDIHDSVTAQKCEIIVAGRNCRIKIAEGCSFPSLYLYLKADNTFVSIGPGTRANSLLWANLSGAGTKLCLGADCLLASVKARTSDSHDILDLGTGEPINPPGDITVEDHVWLGEDVLLLKGAHVGTCSVVGARSLVSGAIPPNSLAVGTPAKVIRSGITWRE